MMLLVFVCAFVGRGMAFLGAGDATCEQTFPYLLLALFSKERKAKRREARRARHPIGYPAYLAHLFSGLLSLYYWLVVVLITP